MTTKKSYVATDCNQELIDLVTAKAVDSKEWRKLLDKVETAGDITAGKELADVGANIWHGVADKMALVAPVAAALDAPITTHLMADKHEWLATLASEFDAAESALCEGGTQADIDACFALRHKLLESRAMVEALSDFRLMCGVISAGIKAAQERIELLARRACCAAEKGQKAKNVRDAIQKMLKRDLAIYGLELDLKKIQVKSIPIPEKTADTDEQKAVKAIISAFKLSPSSAIDAILALDATTRGTIKNAIERAEKEAQIETAKQDAEHKNGAANDIADKVPDNGKPNPDTGRPNVADMVSAVNADGEAKAAARRLADLKAQGTTPEIQADLASADAKGRKIAGM